VFLFASRNGAKTEGRQLDGIGALTCAAGLLGLVFRIIQINHLGLLHRRVLESLAVGIGALLAFVWWERRAGDPLLDITLFRNRIVSVAVTAGLLAALVMGGALLPLLYFLQTVQKVGQISALLRLMPMMVAAGRRACGILPTPGTERAITRGDCRRDGSLAFWPRLSIRRALRAGRFASWRAFGVE
jgi:hypothetical protein